MYNNTYYFYTCQSFFSRPALPCTDKHIRVKKYARIANLGPVPKFALAGVWMEVLNANLGSGPCFEERIKRVRICVVLKVMAGQMAVLLVISNW